MKPQKTENKVQTPAPKKQNRFAFDRINYLLIAVGVIVVIAGMILMSGSGSDPDHFNPDIFSARRIKVAPVVCLLGYIIVGIGIIRKPRS